METNLIGSSKQSARAIYIYMLRTKSSRLSLQIQSFEFTPLSAPTGDHLSN